MPVSPLQVFPSWPPKRSERVVRPSFVRAVAVLFNVGALIALTIGWLDGAGRMPFAVLMLLTSLSAVLVGGLSFMVIRLRHAVFLETASIGGRRRVALVMLICGAFGTVFSWLFLMLIGLEGG